MKIILSEEKITNLILNYLDDNYGDLNSTSAFDEDGNDDWCGVIFYRNDYSDEDVVFRWYDKCWWNSESSDNAKEHFEKSPMIIFENTNDINALNSYFGNRWKSVFRYWFQKNYDNQVKTIE